VAYSLGEKHLFSCLLLVFGIYKNDKETFRIILWSESHRLI